MTITDEMLYACAEEARTIWLATLPAKDALPVRQTSRAFSRRIERLLRQQRMPARKVGRHTWRQAAVAALIAAAALLAVAWTVKSNWAQIVKIISRVFPEWTEYQYSSDAVVGSLPRVTFGYLPEGEIENEQETPDDYRREYALVYADGRYIDLFQVLLTQQSGYNDISYVVTILEEMAVPDNQFYVIEIDGIETS